MAGMAEIHHELACVSHRVWSVVRHGSRPAGRRGLRIHKCEAAIQPHYRIAISHWSHRRRCLIDRNSVLVLRGIGRRSETPEFESMNTPDSRSNWTKQATTLSP